MTMSDPDLAAQLTALSTCDVADALRRLGVPHGGFLPGITMFSPERQGGPTRIAGPAWTIQFVLNEDIDAPRLEGHHMDTVPPGHIPFFSAPPGVFNAVFGGLMGRRARALGLPGAVVDGRVRDLGELRGLGVAVFARDIGTTAPSEVCRPSAVNVPISIPSPSPSYTPTLSPGDWLLADLNGVLLIPSAHLRKVVPLAREMAERDERVGEAIDGEMGVQEAMERFRGGGSR